MNLSDVFFLEYRVLCEMLQKTRGATVKDVRLVRLHRKTVEKYSSGMGKA